MNSEKHNGECFFNGRSVDDLMRAVADNIGRHGQHLVGVTGNQPFTYTVGLLPRWGFELIVFGLPHTHAGTILNTISLRLRQGLTLEFNKPDLRFTNVPIKFIKCGPKAQEFVGVARRYYAVGFDVPVVQIIVCDRAGKFPGEPGFDHERMDPLQPLLY